MIETRINSLENEEDKEKMVRIKTQADDMLENVKHAIVLLQIAKNTVHPITGLYRKATVSNPENKHEFAMVGQGVECREGKAAEVEVDGE